MNLKYTHTQAQINFFKAEVMRDDSLCIEKQ